MRWRRRLAFEGPSCVDGEDHVDHVEMAATFSDTAMQERRPAQDEIDGFPLL
jgi:hypothetical protein